jgi:hypothetical protein
MSTFAWIFSICNKARHFGKIYCPALNDPGLSRSGGHRGQRGLRQLCAIDFTPENCCGRWSGWRKLKFAGEGGVFGL